MGKSPFQYYHLDEKGRARKIYWTPKKVPWERVGETYFEGAYVSTIFAGVGKNGSGPLFETLVMDPLGEVLERLRWKDWIHAKMGHEETVKRWAQKLDSLPLEG